MMFPGDANREIGVPGTPEAYRASNKWVELHGAIVSCPLTRLEAMSGF
jgi:hypothetical protein